MELKVQAASRMDGIVKAPPSKSYTHRGFIMAFLAEGTSKINDPLYSDDTMASLNSCKALGSKVEKHSSYCEITGINGKPSTPDNVLDLKNSGTTLRILTSIATLTDGYTVLTGDKSLRTRPMQDILSALKPLGVTAFSTKNNGKPPIIIKGGFKGGETSINGNVSSQFISSILMASPYAETPVHLNVKDKFISRPYVEMTVELMEKFNVKVEYEREKKSFHIDPQIYRSNDYTVEGDYSSASYLIAAAASLNSEVTIQNLMKNSKQGDKLILDIVKDMGSEVNVKNNEVKIYGQGRLNGVEVNLKNAPDLLPTVAALGAMAKGTTYITGVEHARFKETDRIHTCAIELAKLGVSVTEKDDGLIIRGGVHGGVVKSHMDHRLAMAFYIIGLKVGNVVIEDASVYNVSFPDFPEIIEKLIAGTGK
ncbi:3-phosphoshikimate 1-carboxyvinyltransferase [Methanobacterium sp. SMA-27]|uniref:3-phosphoshikimate 1-carboxyvinyltransferase n=1 Tax=Methanobacterium sp. SMA-27 TaxID=1495336 RepID=UPI00064F4B93|nr:3-phosphoshikimate 1-carboxyvinyltransferase [Methanobacterium sp. SMA-27]